VNAYYGFLQGLKGSTGPKRATYSAIAPQYPVPPTNCYAYEGLANGRNKALAGITGGVLIDVCDSVDWSQILPEIIARAAGRRSVSLTSEPDPGFPIGVSINGAAFPANGPNGEPHWTYDSVANAIRFDLSALPSPGAVVSVSYHLKCLPP
jgi:hypothetical protein